MGAALPLPPPAGALDSVALERLFHGVAAPEQWDPQPVPRAMLDELHDLVSLCPAAAPQAPAGVLFIASEAARVRLLRHTPPRLRANVLLAPVCAVVGYDPGFAEQLVCAGATPSPAHARRMAGRTAALQGAYLMVAARSLGLEAAPLHGMDLSGVTLEFFRDAAARANFVCALGYAA
jgi:3-hydroxypropanoate dehydrogenase